MNSYAQYVHPDGEGWFFVGEWSQERAQWSCPLTKTDARRTGCGSAFWRRPSAAQYIFKTRKRARDFARRLYRVEDCRD